MLASLAYAKPLQEEDELTEFCDFIRRVGARSYLEIGARYGGSFEAVMMAMPRGSVGVAVDFPGGNFGDDESVPILVAARDRVRASGRAAALVFGPSSAPEVAARATVHAPFDVILIDGDHSYQAVKRDFERYAPFGRHIVLHDIVAPPGITSRAGMPVEVPVFWNEIKSKYQHEEILTPGSTMGFGIVTPV